MAVGPAANGLTGVVEVGPNTGRLTPQVFGMASAATDETGLLGVGDVDERFRATLGVVARVAVGSPLKSLDLSSSVGGGFSATRGTSVVAGPPGAVDLDQRKSLWGRGAVGILGFEATQWITPRVGLSVSLHQMVGLPLFRHADVERFRLQPSPSSGLRPETAVSSALDLEYTAVGLGLRIGRQ